MFSRLSCAVVAAIIGSGLGTASPAFAQERRPAEVLAGLSAAVKLQAAPVQDLRETFGLAPYKPHRSSAMLKALYASTIAVQALDAHSTLLALNRGATEANPLLSGLAQHKVAFVALKAGVTVSTLLAARSLSKRNRVAAIATVIAINGAYAAVISHNYRVANRLR